MRQVSFQVSTKQKYICILNSWFFIFDVFMLWIVVFCLFVLYWNCRAGGDGSKLQFYIYRYGYQQIRFLLRFWNKIRKWRLILNYDAKTSLNFNFNYQLIMFV
jgi:hypothetical protein